MKWRAFDMLAAASSDLDAAEQLYAVCELMSERSVDLIETFDAGWWCALREAAAEFRRRTAQRLSGSTVTTADAALPASPGAGGPHRDGAATSLDPDITIPAPGRCTAVSARCVLGTCEHRSAS